MLTILERIERQPPGYAWILHYSLVQENIG
jgi:hypothetical protein